MSFWLWVNQLKLNSKYSKFSIHMKPVWVLCKSQIVKDPDLLQYLHKYQLSISGLLHFQKSSMAP